MNDILNQLAIYLNSAAGVVIFVFAIVGVALTYAGLKIYWLVVFLVGMIPGLIIGAGIGAGMGWPEIGVFLFALLIGGLTGIASIWATVLAIFVLGGFVGAVIAAAFGAQEPVILIIAGLVGGGTFVGLHQVAIVIGTAFTGAGFLTYAAVNTFSIVRVGHPAWLPGSFLSYVGYLGRNAYNSGGLEGAFRSAGSSLLVFLFFFASGLLVQFNFHRIFGGAVKTGAGAADGLLKPKELDWSSLADKKPDVREAEKPAVIEDTATPSLPPPTWRLALFQDGTFLETRSLPAGRYRLGRTEEADIRLADPAVSRLHLEIEVKTDGGLELKDLGSANGTWREGTERILTDSPDHGHWYQMGAAQIIFQRG